MRRLAVVQWRDAYFEFERSGNVSEREDYLVETVGWLDVEQEGPFVSIVSERLPEDDGERAVTNVPGANIVEIVYLTAHDSPELGEYVPDWFTQEY